MFEPFLLYFAYLFSDLFCLFVWKPIPYCFEFEWIWICSTGYGKLTHLFYFSLCFGHLLWVEAHSLFLLSGISNLAKIGFFLRSFCGYLTWGLFLPTFVFAVIFSILLDFSHRYVLLSEENMKFCVTISLYILLSWCCSTVLPHFRPDFLKKWHDMGRTAQRLLFIHTTSANEMLRSVDTVRYMLV